MITDTLPAEIERVLLAEDELAGLVGGLAARLEQDYAGREPVVVGALTGAAIFCADLVRRLRLPLTLDFVSVSSYGLSAVSSGEVKWSKQLSLDIRGREVILVEDIVDTGETLARLQDALRAQSPASLVTCALLNKPSRRRVRVDVDYLGIDIPDEFVVGYGLDYAQRFRNLPYVGVLRRSVYG